MCTCADLLRTNTIFGETTVPGLYCKMKVYGNTLVSVKPNHIDNGSVPPSMWATVDLSASGDGKAVDACFPPWVIAG